MKIVGLVGTTIGWSTRTAMNNIKTILERKYEGKEVDILDLADYNVEFSDGRNYLDYTGDTGKVVRTIMEADVLIIATPVFQASIPGTLKNIFDLLPMDAFVDKTVGIIAVAGSPKHYLVVEQQLKPILSFMKAQLATSYVFAESKDIVKGEIMNQNVLFRIDHLVDNIMHTHEAFSHVKLLQDQMYDF